jgi:hypothetical protein
MLSGRDGLPESVKAHSLARMKATPPDPRPYRVLTVDGGGMRGAYTVAYLAELCRAWTQRTGGEPIDLGKRFDLIVGTSTGAIIACALALGIPLTTVQALYASKGRHIFPFRLKRWNLALQLVLRRWLNQRGALALRKALEDALGDATFRSAFEARGIALCIPAVEMRQQRAWVFKTPHGVGHRDDDTTLVDACMATSAAPIYRSLATIGDERAPATYKVFADGGLWANNPVLVGLVEALEVIDPRRPIEIFSAGNISRPEGKSVPAKKANWGFWRWKFGADAVQLSIASQEYVYDQIAQKLASAFSRFGQSVTVTRFPTGHFSMDLLPHLDIDNATPKALAGLAQQASADVFETFHAIDAKTLDGLRIANLLDGP